MRKKSIKGYSISEGHRFLYLPDHPKRKSNNYYAEHRFLMEQKLGRLLESFEVVHHKNGNGLDNHLSNLELLSPQEHSKKHWNSKRSKFMLQRKKRKVSKWNKKIQFRKPKLERRKNKTKM